MSLPYSNMLMAKTCLRFGQCVKTYRKTKTICDIALRVRTTVFLRDCVTCICRAYNNEDVRDFFNQSTVIFFFLNRNRLLHAILPWR